MATIVLPAFSGPLREPDRYGGRGAAGDAGENALFAGEAARVFDRLLVGHLLDRVDEREVEDAGHEAGADALDLVRAGLHRFVRARLGEDRARRRLDRDRGDRLALVSLM